MAQRVSSELRRDTPPAEPRAHLFPRHWLGWCAFGLLIATSLYPLYFGDLERVVHGAALILVSTVVAVVSLGTGSVALFVRRDRSVLLFLAFAAALFLVLLGLFFVLTLFFLGP